MPIGTLYRRALKRVERRSAAYREAVESGCAGPDMAALYFLLQDACRTANRLAYLSVAHDPRHAPRFAR